MNFQKHNKAIISILSIFLVLSTSFIVISYSASNIHWISTLFKQEPSDISVYQQHEAVAGQLIYKNAYDTYFFAEDNYKNVVLIFKMKDENNTVFYEEKIIFENCKKDEGHSKTHYVSTENMLKAKRVWCELVSYY